MAWLLAFDHFRKSDLSITHAWREVRDNRWAWEIGWLLGIRDRGRGEKGIMKTSRRSLAAFVQRQWETHVAGSDITKMN